MKIKTECTPLHPKLNSNNLHLWSAVLDEHFESIEYFQAYLSPHEMDRAERFKTEKAKAHFIIGRGILKEILGRYLEIEASKINLTYEKLGKPHLEPALQNIIPGLTFNLSHSNGMIMCGVSKDQWLGVDLEYREKTRSFNEIAERFFSVQEIREIKQAQGEQKKIVFYNIWTKKEALLKALGLGLHSPLRQFSVTGQPDSIDQLINLPFDPHAKKWAVFSLNEQPSTFSLSIAMNHLPENLCFWTWNFSR